MRSKKLLAIVAGLALALTLGACAKAPQDKIDAAKAALEEARNAEAAKYVPAAFQKAEDALNSAMAEITAQDAKFALFRSYDQAQQLLAQAEQAAKDVAAEAVTAKEEARKAAEALLTQADTAIADATKALATAPRGKGTASEIAAMKTELETLATSLTEARQAYDGGEYLDAQSKAQAALDKATAISADIAQAKAKKR